MLALRNRKTMANLLRKNGTPDFGIVGFVRTVAQTGSGNQGKAGGDWI